MKFLPSAMVAQYLPYFCSKACFPSPAESGALEAMNGGRIWMRFLQRAQQPALGF